MTIPPARVGTTKLGERAARICEAQMDGDAGSDALLRIIADNLRYYEISSLEDALWYLGDPGPAPDLATPIGRAVAQVRALGDGAAKT